jgi:DNA-binding Lrp family transcriptional regulator
MSSIWPCTSEFVIDIQLKTAIDGPARIRIEEIVGRIFLDTMELDDLYSSAHLFIAAIRVCEHQHGGRASVEDVCGLIGLSLEQGNFICKKLLEDGVIERVHGAFGTRLFIKDHLKIEEIPRKEKGSSLEQEIRKFQDSKKGFAQKIESLKAAQAEKKKNLFADVEKKLKKQLEKK